MIAVDASVLTNAFTDDGPAGEAARKELARDTHWAAPEHVTIETFSAIRSRWRRGLITTTRARDALDALASTNFDLAPTGPLLKRMWELRDNVSGYDVASVALAESRRCRLVTADTRLAHAPDLRCEVTLVPTLELMRWRGRRRSRAGWMSFTHVNPECA